MTEEQRSETVNATNTLITNGLRLPKEYRIMVIEKLMQGIDKHEIITLLERKFGNDSQKEECDHYFPFGYDKATDTMIYDNPCEFCGSPSPYKNTRGMNNDRENSGAYRPRK